MDEISIHYCRICGSDILQSDEICPRCGSIQSVKRDGLGPGWVILFAMVGFLGIAILGIVSARAIPQLTSGVDNAYDKSALYSISAAKRALDGYIRRNGVCPDSLRQISFRPDEGVSVELLRTGDGACTMIASHRNGQTEYAVSSGGEKIYQRSKTAPESRFVAVE